MDLRGVSFGIEVETVNRSRTEVANAVCGVVGGSVTEPRGVDPYDSHKVVDSQGREWKIVRDGSLPDGGAELVSPVLTYQDIPQLQQVVRAIKAIGAKSNHCCGIHVHVDASAFDGRSLVNLAKMTYKQEELVIRALAVSPERLSRYAQKTSRQFIRGLEERKPQSKDEFNPIWYGYRNTAPQHYDSTRYHGVNFHSVWYRGTVEFRWFNGTLHAGKVKAYIQFCLALAAKALNSKSAQSKQRTATGASDRYDFRVFLLSLGLIGSEFKTARKHLMANLAGSAAWKHGRPATQAMRA